MERNVLLDVCANYLTNLILENDSDKYNILGLLDVCVNYLEANLFLENGLGQLVKSEFYERNVVQKSGINWKSIQRSNAVNYYLLRTSTIFWVFWNENNNELFEQVSINKELLEVTPEILVDDEVEILKINNNELFEQGLNFGTN